MADRHWVDVMGIDLVHGGIDGGLRRPVQVEQLYPMPDVLDEPRGKCLPIRISVSPEGMSAVSSAIATEGVRTAWVQRRRMLTNSGPSVRARSGTMSRVAPTSNDMPIPNMATSKLCAMNCITTLSGVTP